MTYHGRVENGAVVLDDPAELPEGAEVEVVLLDNAETTSEDDSIPTLYEQLKPVVGIAKGLPPDLAENHDHYLHGRPRR